MALLDEAFVCRTRRPGPAPQHEPWTSGQAPFGRTHRARAGGGPAGPRHPRDFPGGGCRFTTSKEASGSGYGSAGVNGQEAVVRKESPPIVDVSGVDLDTNSVVALVE
jgi:hypothetical protein